jgi:hypothetical protein
MNGTGRRMSQADFKERAVGLIKAFGPGAFDEAPLWMQVTVLAALKTDDEEAFVIELRKFFYLFGELEQLPIIKSAFEDPSEESAPIRRLIRELPSEHQLKILASVR